MIFKGFILMLIIPLAVGQTGHPKFDLELESVILVEGSLEKVVCVAEGEPPLIYTWYNKSDMVITSDTKNSVFIRETPEGSSLIFDVVDLSHGGLYTCSAKNKHGTASKTYDIVVNSTSNITVDDTGSIDSVDILNITENSVTFLVKTSGDPRSFFIRYQEELDNESYKEIRKGDKAVVNEACVTIKVEIEIYRSIDDIKRKTIDEHELTYNRVEMYGSRIEDCVINIKIPIACTGSRYTIAGLSAGFYYEIRVRAHTKTGYGNPYRNKIR
ncbi:ig-like domain-containing protein [Caerostris darwini]|uniref:Ig-like domain-containing protein n=1 Tax=Caerostris darwini TaxID=1538125 RepID=A0AAV4S230_9ARAC|nr:ig-like domain-containing protein [Caerostris darwini]